MANPATPDGSDGLPPVEKVVRAEAMKTSLEEMDALLASVLRDPTTSRWLRDALNSALVRDAVDVANDAGYLADLLTARASAATLQLSKRSKGE